MNELIKIIYYKCNSSYFAFSFLRRTKRNAKLLFKILENIFAYFVKRRNASYDLKKKKHCELSIPVISIGNISVGGSGKTPFTIELAKLLIKNNIRPAIIGRGYKRQSSGGLIVSDGANIFANPEQAGDEMFLIAKKIPSPVVVHQKKYEAAKIVEKNFKVNAILLDDGFQHRKLKRDLDIVIVDSKTIEQPCLLPRGRLREPLASLSRADILLLYSKNDLPKISCFLKKDAEVFFIQVKSDGIRRLDDYSHLACDSYKEKNSDIPPFVNADSKNTFATLSSIANPNRFINSLKDFKIKHSFIFRDHHIYRKKDIQGIIKQSKQLKINAIISTEKDAVKLYKYKKLFVANSIFVYVFSIKIDILNLEKFTENILKTFQS